MHTGFLQHGHSFLISYICDISAWLRKQMGESVFGTTSLKQTVWKNQFVQQKTYQIPLFAWVSVLQVITL